MAGNLDKPDKKAAEPDSEAANKAPDKGEAAALPERELASENRTDKPTDKLQAVCYEKASPGDWKPADNKNLIQVSDEKLNRLLKTPLLSEAGKELNLEKPAIAQTALLSPEFNFDKPLDSGIFRNLGGSFTSDLFGSGREIKELGQMGFGVSNLDTANFMGSGIYTPEQIDKMFGFNSSSMDAKNWGWGKGGKGLSDDGLNHGLLLGNTILANNIDKSGWLDTFSTSFFDETNLLSAKAGITTTSSSWMDTFKGWGSKAYDLGSKAIDGVTNAVIDFGASCRREIREGANGEHVLMSTDGNRRTLQTEKNTIQQVRDESGKIIDTKVSTNDGRLTVQRDQAGNITATNKDADISIRKNQETGKVEALDRSGKAIATFDDRGDAKRFFDNAVTSVVTLKPGETLDDKYKEYMANLAKEIKEDPSKATLAQRPVMLMDGNGGALTVRSDGTRFYTHEGGKAEMLIQHTDPVSKTSQTLELRIRRDAEGNEVFTIGKKGDSDDKFIDLRLLNSKEAKDEAARKQLEAILAHSRVRMNEGQVQINDETAGKPASWRNLMDRNDPRFKHRMQMWQSAHPGQGGFVDLDTNKLTVNDGKVQAEYTAQTKLDPATGKQVNQVTAVETAVQPDGTLAAHPNRIITTNDQGLSTIQGLDPRTGEARPNDTVVINSRTGTVDAWVDPNNPESGIRMDRERTTLFNDDRSRVEVNNTSGDIEAKDRNGNTILATSGDKVSFDGRKTYEEWRRDYDEKQARIAVETAACQAQQILAAIAGCRDNPAALAGYASELAALINSLPAGYVPSQVGECRSEIADALANLTKAGDVENQVEQTGVMATHDLLYRAETVPQQSVKEMVVFALNSLGYELGPNGSAVPKLASTTESLFM